MKLQKDKEGQARYVSAVIVGFVSVMVGFIIFFLASPILKQFIENTKTTTGPLTSFLITIIPYVVLLILIVIFITVTRGGAEWELNTYMLQY